MNSNVSRLYLNKLAKALRINTLGSFHFELILLFLHLFKYPDFQQHGYFFRSTLTLFSIMVFVMFVDQMCAVVLPQFNECDGAKKEVNKSSSGSHISASIIILGERPKLLMSGYLEVGKLLLA